jgi:hypothetical protein
VSGHDFSHCPPECDRVMQAPRLWPKCPIHPLAGDPASAHSEKIGAKSLWLKILKISLSTSRFCGEPLVFSRFYGEQGEGGGEAGAGSQWPAVSSQWPVASRQPVVSAQASCNHEIQPSRNVIGAPSLQPCSGGYEVRPGREPRVRVDTSPEPRSGGSLSPQFHPNIPASSDKQIAKSGAFHAC